MDDSRIARLLEHPAIWRGRSAARLETLPSGFAALDEALPGGGWPRAGLIEILIGRFGSGELSLLLPALAALTRAASARWCVWVAPPLMPFAPALVAQGVRARSDRRGGWHAAVVGARAGAALGGLRCCARLEPRT